MINVIDHYAGPSCMAYVAPLIIYLFIFFFQSTSELSCPEDCERVYRNIGILSVKKKSEVILLLSQNKKIGWFSQTFVFLSALEILILQGM